MNKLKNAIYNVCYKYLEKDITSIVLEYCGLTSTKNLFAGVIKEEKDLGILDSFLLSVRKDINPEKGLVFKSEDFDTMAKIISNIVDLKTEIIHFDDLGSFTNIGGLRLIIENGSNSHDVMLNQNIILLIRMPLSVSGRSYSRLILNMLTHETEFYRHLFEPIKSTKFKTYLIFESNDDVVNLIKNSFSVAKRIYNFGCKDVDAAKAIHENK